MEPKLRHIKKEEVIGYRKDALRQKKDLLAKPAPKVNPATLERSGFREVVVDGELYYYRHDSSSNEAIKLDEQGRKAEYWLNWDRADKSVVRTTYDSDGYVQSIQNLQGTGWGERIKVLYQKDIENDYILTNEGFIIPHALRVEQLVGNDPTSNWYPRTLKPGKVVDTFTIDLTQAK